MGIVLLKFGDIIYASTKPVNMIIMTVPVNLRSSAIIVGAVIIGAYVIFGGPSDIRRRKKRKGNIPGLANIGNSCFFECTSAVISILSIICFLVG